MNSRRASAALVCAALFVGASAASATLAGGTAGAEPFSGITMKIERTGLGVNVNVRNDMNGVPGQCTYNATEVNRRGFPVVREFDLGPQQRTTLSFPAPLIGQTYRVVVACRGDMNGQGAITEFGRAEQMVSG